MTCFSIIAIQDTVTVNRKARARGRNNVQNDGNGISTLATPAEAAASSLHSLFASGLRSFGLGRERFASLRVFAHVFAK